MFSALEVFYENALYKFTFDIDIDIDIRFGVGLGLGLEGSGLGLGLGYWWTCYKSVKSLKCITVCSIHTYIILMSCY